MRGRRGGKSKRLTQRRWGAGDAEFLRRLEGIIIKNPRFSRVSPRFLSTFFPIWQAKLRVMWIRIPILLKQAGKGRAAG